MVRRCQVRRVCCPPSRNLKTGLRRFEPGEIRGVLGTTNSERLRGFAASALRDTRAFARGRPPETLSAMLEISDVALLEKVVP